MTEMTEDNEPRISFPFDVFDGPWPYDQTEIRQIISKMSEMEAEEIKDPFNLIKNIHWNLKELKNYGIECDSVELKCLYIKIISRIDDFISKDKSNIKRLLEVNEYLNEDLENYKNIKQYFYAMLCLWIKEENKDPMTGEIKALEKEEKELNDLIGKIKPYYL
ncbi:MAG: hypothetical protein MJ252_23920 [archaeon]|nr:hypothetical protein [archaeon]